jgi:hypothetical protein
MHRIKRIMLNETVNEFVDKGIGYPRLKYDIFIDRPKNNEKKRLSPMDRTNRSLPPNLFNFNK